MRLTPLFAAAALLVAPVLAARLVKTAPPAPPKSGLRADLLTDLDDVQKKVMQLAVAIPAAKYSWRPGRGVRSVSEVYMHIAGGNYIAASAINGKSASSETGTLERIVDKERVLDELRKSFDQLHDAILATTDADLDKTLKMYGTETTERSAMLTALNHIHEHLGQSIAYARMNGVVPPWSKGGASQ
jgi:uncharacterized damage-inducible protein DinB